MPNGNGTSEPATAEEIADFSHPNQDLTRTVEHIEHGRPGRFKHKLAGLWAELYRTGITQERMG